VQALVQWPIDWKTYEPMFCRSPGFLKQPWEDEAWAETATERAKGRRDRRRVDGAILIDARME
jgi:hypothetical protein